MSDPQSIASLAYLGDAVFELCVRDMLVRGQGLTLNGYNKLAKRYVSAIGQSAIYHKVYPFLTEDEQQTLRRGRNLNTASRAKNATVTAYRHATGLKTLFGHLYITGQHERLQEIFKLCTAESESDNNGK